MALVPPSPDSPTAGASLSPPSPVAPDDGSTAATAVYTFTSSVTEAGSITLEGSPLLGFSTSPVGPYPTHYYPAYPEAPVTAEGAASYLANEINSLADSSNGLLTATVDGASVTVTARLTGEEANLFVLDSSLSAGGWDSESMTGGASRQTSPTAPSVPSINPLPASGAPPLNIDGSGAFDFGPVNTAPEADPDCVSYWRAQAGSTISDLVGDNDLTVIGDPVLDADGGVYFDGTANRRAYSAIDGLEMSGDFSVILFARRSSLSNQSLVFGLSRTDGPNDWAIVRTAGTSYMQANLDDGAALYAPYFPGDGELVMLAMVFTSQGDGTHTLRLSNWGSYYKERTGAIGEAMDIFGLAKNPGGGNNSLGDLIWFESGLFNRAFDGSELQAIANGMMSRWFPDSASYPFRELFLLAGQSNARSNGGGQEPTAYTATGAESSNLYVGDVYGNDDKSRMTTPLAVTTNGGEPYLFGPEMTFAAEANAKGRYLAVFKLARSGTGFGTAAAPLEWHPVDGSVAQDWYQLVEAAPWIVRANGYTPLAGVMVWIHGEADSGSQDGSTAAEKGAEYLTNLESLWANTKAAYGGDGLSLVVTEVRNGTAEVRDAQVDFANAQDDVVYFATDSYPFFDGVHYSAEATLQMGRDLEAATPRTVSPAPSYPALSPPSLS